MPMQTLSGPDVKAYLEYLNYLDLLFEDRLVDIRKLK